jgi:hypothetical protein
VNGERELLGCTWIHPQVQRWLDEFDLHDGIDSRLDLNKVHPRVEQVMANHFDDLRTLGKQFLGWGDSLDDASMLFLNPEVAAFWGLEDGVAEGTVEIEKRVLALFGDLVQEWLRKEFAI